MAVAGQPGWLMGCLGAQSSPVSSKRAKRSSAGCSQRSAILEWGAVAGGWQHHVSENIPAVILFFIHWQHCISLSPMPDAGDLASSSPCRRQRSQTSFLAFRLFPAATGTLSQRCTRPSNTLASSSRWMRPRVAMAAGVALLRTVAVDGCRSASIARVSCSGIPIRDTPTVLWILLQAQMTQQRFATHRCPLRTYQHHINTLPPTL